MTIFETILSALDLTENAIFVTRGGAKIKLLEDDSSSCLKFRIEEGDDEFEEGEREWIDIVKIDFEATMRNNGVSKKTPNDDGWDYAVAEDLQRQANEARDAYNAYVARKPKTQFNPL